LFVFLCLKSIKKKWVLPLAFNKGDESKMKHGGVHPETREKPVFMGFLGFQNVILSPSLILLIKNK